MSGRACLAAIVLFVSGISAQQPGPSGVPDDLHIRLERTRCFGTCPEYVVTIDAKGNVTYEGRQFVRVTGKRRDRIPVSRVAALLETADRIGFDELRDSYRALVTDHPTTYVTIRRGGQSKRVEDYVSGPEGLKRLQREIDEAARTRRWISIDLPELQQMVQEGHAPRARERADMLRQALQDDDVDVVKALLDLGADPNEHSHSTRTPPLMMVRSGAAARALLAAGANPFVRNDNGWSPLTSSVYLAPDVAEALVKAGVPVDQPSGEDGATALWHAACRGNIGVVRVLLAAGADPRITPSNGKTAIQCAREMADFERTHKRYEWEGKAPYTVDFDGAIELLKQALAKSPSR